jgi:outer membrane protein assembly factor BamB
MKKILLLAACLGSGYLFAQFPSLNWSYPLPCPAFGSAASADVDGDGYLEIIFTTYTNDGQAHCLNAEDGSVRWIYDIGGCGDVAPLIYDFDMDDTLDVFVNGSCNPTAFCINAMTGALKWSVASGGGDSPPTVADIDNDGKPEILFGNFSGQVRILNGEDGSINRTVVLAPSIGPIQTEPTIGDLDGDGDLDFIVCNHFNTSGFYTWAYDYGTDDTLWTNFQADTSAIYYSYHGGVLADVDNDTRLEYVIGDNAGGIRALNAEDGSVRWSVDGLTNVISALSCANFDADSALEIVYVNNDYVLPYDDHIGLLDGATGALDWSYDITFSAFRGVAISDLNGNGKLDCVSGHYMGELIAVEPFTGLIWNYNSDPLLPSGLPYWEVANGPIIADFDKNGTMDVFSVTGYGTYTPDSMNVGTAFCVEAGNNATGCPEWRMFRQDVWRSGYLSTSDIDENCDLVQVNDPKTFITKVYPNPSSGHIKVEIAVFSGTSLFEIRDVLGQLLVQKQLSPGVAEWDLELSAGTYFWSCQQQDQRSSGKLTVIR